jgi:hypothetical protein
MLSNNDILKKIRVALSLRTEEVIHILSLVDFHITKGALGDLYRHEDHPNYQEAGDQILRRFLDGLVIYKRGQQEAKAGETVIDLRNQTAQSNAPKPVVPPIKKQPAAGKLTYQPKPQTAKPSQSASSQFKSNYKKPK